MPAKFTGEVKVLDGLDGYRFAFVDNSLDNGEVIPENKCFCRKGKCLPAGLIDVHDCYYGFPIGVSYPHFYQADPALVEAVDGSYPEKEKHESNFYIEPKSGLPLDVTVRFQINLALGDLSGIMRAAKFSNMTLPMLWTEFRMAKLPEDLSSRFVLYLKVMPMVEKALMYMFFCVGVMLLLGSISRILLLNWDLQKQCANMDFSHGNSKELKKIHLKKTKSKDKWSTSDTNNGADAFYTSLLEPPAVEDAYECSLNIAELGVLTDNANKIYNKINPLPTEGIDNNTCDTVEAPLPQYGLINLCHLKEENV